MSPKPSMCYSSRSALEKLMLFNRRTFLGSALLGSAGLCASPAFADSSPTLLARARTALAQHRSHITHTDVIAIADFTLASRQPRFHLVDIANGRTTSLLVAHGRGSDPANIGFVERFSNQPGSYATSNGSYVTGDLYVGKHGRSRRLIGLDSENDQALPRAIVIHAAPYVTHDMAKTQGRVGRSQGCFTVTQVDLEMVLDRLGPGRLLFAGK
jgi:L,D-transpeptidase catalytic domain